MVHLVPTAIFPTPAKFNFDFGRLLSLLRRNPKHWPSVASVFMVVPTFAALSVYHKLQSPDVIFTRDNCEPWQKYDHKQYNFLSNIDHENYVHPRPRF